MQIFHCQCGSTLFFENNTCLTCKRELGYLPDRQTIAALEPAPSGAYRACSQDPARTYRKCRNYADENVCNWMVPADDPIAFCMACRLNDTIPDLRKPENRVYWAKIETAKRRLVYSLLRFGLPIKTKAEDPEAGLAFAFLANPVEPGPWAPAVNVITGHADGLITLNIAEADEIEREQVRRKMHESYRTLLGHFRHEIGHYYWDRLIRDSASIERFRSLFGDERADYSEALRRHYASGGPPDWQDRFISTYASSHPWEDWAETWAHYFHMTDTLETSKGLGISAHDGAVGLIDRELFGFSEQSGNPSSTGPLFVTLLRDWVWLSLAMNSINRSMGMRDAYPFVLNQSVAHKLAFVHDVIARGGTGAPMQAYLGGP